MRNTTSCQEKSSVSERRDAPDSTALERALTDFAKSGLANFGFDENVLAVDIMKRRAYPTRLKERSR